MVSAPMDQHEIVREPVDDAIADGAERALRRPARGSARAGKYIEPTVLTGVSHEM